MKFTPTRCYPLLLALSGACAIVRAGTPFASDALSDPTRPSGVGERVNALLHGVPMPLRIDGFIHCDQRHLAIVNGKLVHEGDHVGDAIIEHIGDDTVSYTQAGRAFTGHLVRASLHVRQSIVSSGDRP